MRQRKPHAPICPGCLAPITTAGVFPRPADLAVCWRCALVLIVTPQQTLRAMTDRELANMSPNDKQTIERVVNATLRGMRPVARA